MRQKNHMFSDPLSTTKSCDASKMEIIFRGRRNCSNCHYIIRSAAWILRAFLVSFSSSFRPIYLQYIKISLASIRHYLSLLKADFFIDNVAGDLYCIFCFIKTHPKLTTATKKNCQLAGFITHFSLGECHHSFFLCVYTHNMPMADNKREKFMPRRALRF